MIFRIYLIFAAISISTFILATLFSLGRCALAPSATS